MSLRRVLGRPAFRRVFLAHSISRAGDAFNAVALVVLVFRITDSAVGVAGTVAFEIAPVLLLGPSAGLLADRYPRRTVMLLADLLRAALAAVLALSHTSVALTYAVAFGLSTGAVIFNPATSALLPETVDDDDLVTANSALWTVAVLAQIAFAPLAGLLISLVGVGSAFGLNALSFLASAALLRRLEVGRLPAARETPRRRALSQGLAAVRGSPLLRRLAMVQVLAALSAGATGGLLVVLAAERFRVGPSGFGLLLGAIGIGAVLGPVVLGRFIRAGERRYLFAPLVVRGGVDLTLAQTTSPVLGGTALTAYGIATSTGMIAFQSTVQAEVPSERRGRAFAFFDVLWNGSRLASLGLGGLLADAAGVRTVYIAGGALLLVAAVIGFSGVPADRDRC